MRTSFPEYPIGTRTHGRRISRAWATATNPSGMTLPCPCALPAFPMPQPQPTGAPCTEGGGHTVLLSSFHTAGDPLALLAYETL